MNKKILAKLSLILSIVSLLSIVLPIDSLEVVKIVLVVCILIAIVAVVFGFIGKKESKGFGIAGIIIGLISCILTLLSLFGVLIIGQLKNCVDKGNGKAVCELKGQSIEMPIDYLTDNQMK